MSEPYVEETLEKVSDIRDQDIVYWAMEHLDGDNFTALVLEACDGDDEFKRHLKYYIKEGRTHG